jgi:hypothetical protein
VPAQSPVTVTINTKSPGSIIPTDFNGLSFESLSLRKDNAGVNGYFFDSINTQLLTLFSNLGIKNLRIGGSSIDSNKYDYVPANEDIDALFRFAKAAGVNVIYSLRLKNGNSTQDASSAKYIWDNYKQYIDCFSIGNEPNIYHGKDPDITDYSSYLAKWREFAAVVVDSVPDIKLGGPDNDNGGTTWGTNFAHDEKVSGIVKSIFFHYYVGNSAKNKTPQQIIDEVLSPDWITTDYPIRYNASGAVALLLGFPYRFTESNSYYVPPPGIQGGNNCFATALFALDYMYWWSEHGAAGVNFHTTQWKYNGTIYLDADGNFDIYPMGYGIKAFDVGGHGRMDSVLISNPNNLDLTAYAVAGSNGLYVTIINKEHDSGARDAKVNIKADNYSDGASVIYLKSLNGAVGTTDITLGGEAISDTSIWHGVWSPIDSTNMSSGNYIVTVPASSAAIVRIINSATSIQTLPFSKEKFMLGQNYPNPFNPITSIHYQIPFTGQVLLKVYEILGREVRILVNKREKAGNYKINFDASKLSSGVYF